MTRIFRTISALVLFCVLTVGVGLSAAYADQPKAWGLWTQDPATPIMRQIVDLNGTITGIMIAITLLVFAIIGIILVRFGHKRNPEAKQWAHNTLLEVAWTLIPVLILVGIAFPSFKLLFAMDRTEAADYTLKVTGHQWYWSYAYPDLNVAFDANIAPDETLQPGQPRLLATDNAVYVPVGAVVRVQTTADDVIHDWSVPAFGIKLDAIPGRLNESWFKVEKPGIYYGNCAQLCGVNHGFMPIEVHAVAKEEFDAWVAQTAQKSASVETKQLTVASLTKE